MPKKSDRSKNRMLWTEAVTYWSEARIARLTKNPNTLKDWRTFGLPSRVVGLLAQELPIQSDRPLSGEAAKSMLATLTLRAIEKILELERLEAFDALKRLNERLDQRLKEEREKVQRSEPE